MKYALGLMSGTSGDGLSLALAGFSSKKFKTIAYETFPYPPALARKIAKAGDLKTPALSKLNAELGMFFAECAVSFLRKTPRRCYPMVAGSHGHTVFHAGQDKKPHTIQIGAPSYLSDALKIPVVSDFRPRDIAAGGQGAPLIPFFDEFFFGDKLRALQNIGGIGNVTLAGSKKPVAFDTGPGNCLMDWAVQKYFRKKYDEGGKIASRGKVLIKAVEAMARKPYFQQKPPKSTGRELFNPAFIPAPLKRAKPADLVASLTYFTALTIKQGCKKFLPPVKEVVVSGGGALNKTLMLHLSNLFSPVPVSSIEKYQVPAQAKEPVAFAFFALRALENKINHCPQGTGARQPAILGKITPCL